MTGVPPVRGRVSVVVTHYEQHDDLARTLAALRRQTRPPHEVVVTDDGSAHAPRVPPGVRLVTQADDGFRAALARNRAADTATGDVLVFLDADTAPEPGYLEALTAPLAAEPDLLLVGRRRFTSAGAPGDWDGSDPLRGAVEAELATPTWLTDGWRATDDLRAADATSFRYVIGATLACSAWWFRRVGGFDTTFARYGGEDWDLAHRWWSSGGRFRHVPGAVAWHHGADASTSARTWDQADATTQAITLARRVNAAPVAFRGLLAAPPRVVLTHERAGLADDELVIAVDAFLTAVPQAAVLSDHPVWDRVPDPRVRSTTPDALEQAAVRVHLHRGVLGAADVWAHLLDGTVDGGPVTRVLHADGDPVVALTDLRRLRRVALGLEPPATGTAAAPPGLRVVGDLSLPGWLGGWSGA